MAHTIYIRGIPENKQITEVRVHTTPGLNTPVPFRVPVGATATCTAVQPDPTNDSFNGQVYHWFNLNFPDGRGGWVRDDLLDMQGDCTAFGYGNYDSRTFAFGAAKVTAPVTTPPAASNSVSAAPAAPATSATPAAPAVTVTVQPPNTPTMTTTPADPATPQVNVNVAAPTIPTTPATPDVSVNVAAPTTSTTPAVPTTPTAPVSTAPATSEVNVNVATPSAPVSTAPAVSVNVASPAPVAAPAVPATTATTAAATGCTATVRMDSRVKMRAKPSVNSDQVGFLEPGTVFTVQAVEQGQDGQPFRWFQTTWNNVTGYIREDLVIAGPDCAALLGTSAIAPVTAPDVPASTTLNPSVLLADPLKVNYFVYQEYGDTRFGSAHKGTDLTSPNGGPIIENAPIYCTGNATVHLVIPCTRCTPDKPTFQSQGLQFWDAQAVRDPAWGYGFGNHVILKFAWADLPSTMRQEMTNRNLTNGFAYVIYAHMNRIDVTQGTHITDGTQIGILGNTGNSTGHHLHIEIHLSLNGNEQDYFNRVTANPRLMYQI